MCEFLWHNGFYADLCRWLQREGCQIQLLIPHVLQRESLAICLANSLQCHISSVTFCISLIITCIYLSCTHEIMSLLVWTCFWQLIFIPCLGCVGRLCFCVHCWVWTGCHELVISKLVISTQQSRCILLGCWICLESHILLSSVCITPQGTIHQRHHVKSYPSKLKSQQISTGPILIEFVYDTYCFRMDLIALKSLEVKTGITGYKS